MLRFLKPLFPVLPWLVFGLMSAFTNINHFIISAITFFIAIYCNLGSLNNSKSKIAFIFFYLIFINLPYVQQNKSLASITIYVALFLESGISLLLKKPFTLEYAKKITPKEYWEDPHFYTVNYSISLFWLLIFLLCVIATLILPPTIKSLTTACLLILGAYYSFYYPGHYQKTKGLV